MSEITIHRSLTNSVTHDAAREQQDQVVFENVADQYVKGEDVTVRFIVFNDTVVDPAEHQIGLLRVGIFSRDQDGFINAASL